MEADRHLELPRFVAPCLAEVVPMKAEEEKRGRRGGEASKV